LDASEFEGALNECEIAARFLFLGLGVEFVPREDNAGRRTPDLKVGNQRQTVEVECKLKDPLAYSEIDTQTYKWLQGQCSALTDRLDLDVEIRALVIGPPVQKTFEDALAHIETRVRDGVRGWQHESRVPMVLGVNDARVDCPPLNQDIISWGIKEGFIDIKLNALNWPGGTPIQGKYGAIGIAALDATTLEQVDKSIRAARDQVSPDGLAILVLTLSLAGSRHRGLKHDTYLNILSNALEHRVWGAGRNTRFGAIVLKLSPIEIDAPCGGWKYTSRGSLYTYAAQPSLRISSNLSISELADSIGNILHMRKNK
jgi:hypothetical protein